jgi:LPXTG-site transpeptidase (sortase) family protein
MKKLTPVFVMASMFAFGAGMWSMQLHSEQQAPVVTTPLPPDAGVTVAATTSAPSVQEKPVPQSHGYPTAVRIPSIKLNDPVIPVGVNGKGEMDVPSGATRNVGWYSPGTVPGTPGSAVMDAHVFAAFANLKKVRVGDTIDVPMSDGAVLHFRVYETHTYMLADVPVQRLFNASDGEYLNLITCAGKLTPDHSTYDHRLIVYAKLVQ